MHWLVSQKAACEFSRHNLQRIGPSSYVYLLFTFLLFLLLFLLVLFPSSLLLFFFFFLFWDCYFYYCLQRLLLGKHLSLERQTHSTTTWAAVWQTCPSSAWESFEVTKIDFRILWFFSFPPKEKKKKKERPTYWVPKEPFHMINLFSLDFFNFTKHSFSVVIFFSYL